jgi:hypothetical protein
MIVVLTPATERGREPARSGEGPTPRCPACRSAHITIVVSLFPEAFCSACGARWIQDGSRQRAVTRESTFRRPGPARRLMGGSA